MFPERLDGREFREKQTGETIVFDAKKHQLIEAHSFPGPEYTGDLEILMKSQGLTIVETNDPKLARGVKEI